MSKLKKVLLMCTAYALVAALAIGGTIAYLTSDDSDVNVMTMGNVKIEQIEQQYDENGNLVDFVQDKPLYPYVGTLGWKNTTEADGAYRSFTMNNVVDKYVSVKNTGKSDAYVRTVFAFEMGDYATIDAFRYNVIGVSTNAENGAEFDFDGAWNWGTPFVAVIDGENYMVWEAVHSAAVAPKTTTIPSLLQVYMNKNCDNEEVTKVDGNENGTYDILVFSQAVQAAGFADAKTALDTAFGKSSEKAAEWFGGVIAEHSADTWDGTADTTWYDPANPLTEYEITTAEQLAGLSELVDGGNNFAGKTVKLGKDLDLAGLPFNPIGHSSNGKSFNGTFDGQGHTISNMYEQSDLSAWQYEGEYYGLFAYTNGATIKNVTIADAYISSGRNEAAGVVGNAVNTTFSDITISNTTLIAYNNSAGGVAAECYGDCSFTNITVDEDTVIGPLWGTHDVRLGGVVGMVQAGNNVTFKDITVACQLDAINDVAANYQYWLYRYSGMLIGHVDGVNGVADPSGYVTCENVKVIYGDWVNYHYCEFESLGAGSYNGPGEYKYARVEAGTGTDGIDLSTCNHDADESHNVLIVFDQLFGGGQGVSGLKTYDGVTVIY